MKTVVKECGKQEVPYFLFESRINAPTKLEGLYLGSISKCIQNRSPGLEALLSEHFLKSEVAVAIGMS